MRSGVTVLGIFAFLWAAAAIVGDGRSLWLLALPLALSSGLYLWAARTPSPPRPPEVERRIGRAVAIWSAVEGAAIFLAVNVLINLGARDAVPAAIAMIVGLHFLPLARAFPQPLYYWTGALLVLAGAAGLLLPAGHRLAIVGGLAALILWSSAVVLIARGRRAQAPRA
jgi:hypothetical protein